MKKHLDWRPGLKSHNTKKYLTHQMMNDAQVLGNLPSAVDLRPLNPPIVNQDQENSCSGNASTYCYDFNQMREIRLKVPGSEDYTNTFQPSSRNFAYYNGRRIEMPNKLRDQGVTSLRDLCVGFQKYGNCPETLWPYDESQVNTMPSQASFDFAANHKIKNFYELDGTAGELTTCLAAGFPVMCGIPIFESFMSTGPDGLVPNPTYNDEPEGGHAVAICGYDLNQKLWLMRNSWGTSWGQQGYFQITFDYLTLANDFLTLRNDT